jgi:hypothetical protein
MPLSPTTHTSYHKPLATKRTFEMMLKAEYAKYGVIDGVLSVEENERVVCSIICGGWPSWAMGALTRGWLVTRIVVKKSAWIDRLKTWFPEFNMPYVGE